VTDQSATADGLHADQQSSGFASDLLQIARTLIAIAVIQQLA